jgi:excisionase family DNA binding protein
MAETALADTPDLRRYEALTDAARRLGVSDELLRRRARAGVLRTWRIGRKVLLLRGDADALLRPCEQQATSN